MQKPAHDTQAASRKSPLAGGASPSRRYVATVIALLVVAGVWRWALAAAMPCLARDGALFCWYARDLGRQGLGLFETGDYEQHPLFPLATLAVQRVLRWFGAPDVPETWLHSGQLVAWVAGMAVVAVTFVLTLRLVRRLELPVQPRQAALLALALAAILPLNTWLSADVMSDQLHLAFYLGGVVLLIGLDNWKAALACGLLSGLAFVTRPEGAVVCFAGLVVLAAQLRAQPPRKLAAAAVAGALGFLVCAAPYMIATGKLSAKLDKEPLEKFTNTSGLFRTGEPAVSSPQQAALSRREIPWYGLVPFVLYTAFRGGRVVIPLLALPSLIHLRRRLLRPPLLGVVTCIAAHFTLTAMLQAYAGYLQPRHTLVVVMLLVPFAAIFLIHLRNVLAANGRLGLARALVALCLLPLAAYSLRTPNGADAYIAEAARKLRDADPEITSRLLLGGSSQRRLAFYADMRMQPWPENEPTLELRYAALRDHLLGSRPDYFAIDTGAGNELEGNDVLLDRLRRDEQVTAHIAEIRKQPSTNGMLHIWRLRW